MLVSHEGKTVRDTRCQSWDENGDNENDPFEHSVVSSFYSDVRIQ